jgi:uncharacterized protein YceK
MRGRVAACVVVALAASVGGCATAINMQDAAMRKPYGGFTMSPDDFFGGSEAGEYVVVRFWPMWLLDKPLSLVADTVTLPYTLWVQRDAKLHPNGSNAVPGQVPRPTGWAVPPSANGTSQGNVPAR